LAEMRIGGGGGGEKVIIPLKINHGPRTSKWKKNKGCKTEGEGIVGGGCGGHNTNGDISRKKLLIARKLIEGGGAPKLLL